VAGESGGGLQTQMVVALDPRAKAATIVGLTCDFREIMFPAASHCACNHFPGVMRWTDHPETSTLGLPAAVQYLTMNDWTKTFREKNFPTIQKFYAAHGVGDRVECLTFDTPHNYDQPKREKTYQWMERWVRGRASPGPIAEPETQTFPVETLVKLKADVPDKGFAEIGRIYRRERGYRAPILADRKQGEAYRQRMVLSLKELLGEAVVLPRKAATPKAVERVEGDLLLAEVGFASEGPLVVPAIVLRPKDARGKLPVVVMLGPDGKDRLLAGSGKDSPRRRAAEEKMVVLPDLRCFGTMLSTGTDNLPAQRQAWERNGILWGRPVPGMGVTDLRAVLDGLAQRPDADMSRVEVVTQKSGDAAIVAVFAAALDERIAAVEADFAGCCFEKRNLPLVSNVLQHGDVLQWAALISPRRITLKNVPPEAGDPAWLEGSRAAAARVFH
jgi:cephalosporin-C deacetylase-like acetyl esterase